MHEDEYQGEGPVGRYSEAKRGIGHTLLSSSVGEPHAWQVQADTFLKWGLKRKVVSIYVGKVEENETTHSL